MEVYKINLGGYSEMEIEDGVVKNSNDYDMGRERDVFIVEKK